MSILKKTAQRTNYERALLVGYHKKLGAATPRITDRGVNDKRDDKIKFKKWYKKRCHWNATSEKLFLYA